MLAPNAGEKNVAGINLAFHKSFTSFVELNFLHIQIYSFVKYYFAGLFYDTVQNEIGAEMAYIEANKLNQQAAVAMARSLREEELAKQRSEQSESEASHKGR